MSVELVTKFSPYVDEAFSSISKRELLTNNNYDWTGAHVVRIYTVTTAPMVDYDRSGVTLTAGKWSRYGTPQGLDATTQELQLKRDRSFTFVIDRLDIEETDGVLNAAAALARQIKEVIVPEVDKYCYGEICKNAGSKPAAMVLTSDNIYSEILEGNAALDDAEVPETDRVLLVTPNIYLLMMRNSDIIMDTNIGQKQRRLGIIGMLDGCQVVKVPKNRVPADCGFLLVHPSAAVAPVKLEEYQVHTNPIGISGTLVEGRICYDTFVLNNKAKAIYYQTVKASSAVE